MWLRMTLICKLVHGYTEYTERAPRRQQFHVAPAIQQPNIAVSTPALVDILHVYRAESLG